MPVCGANQPAGTVELGSKGKFVKNEEGGFSEHQWVFRGGFQQQF